MEGKKLASNLNIVSNGDAVYSFDEKLNKILCINKNSVGCSMTLETAFEELYQLATMMLLALKDVFEDLHAERYANNGGKKDV